jgi:hypothetical protein
LRRKRKRKRKRRKKKRKKKRKRKRRRRKRRKKKRKNKNLLFGPHSRSKRGEAHLHPNRDANGVSLLATPPSSLKWKLTL